MKHSWYSAAIGDKKQKKGRQAKGLLYNDDKKLKINKDFLIKTKNLQKNRTINKQLKKGIKTKSPFGAVLMSNQIGGQRH